MNSIAGCGRAPTRAIGRSGIRRGKPGRPKKARQKVPPLAFEGTLQQSLERALFASGRLVFSSVQCERRRLTGLAKRDIKQAFFTND
jgi:hypothetical protein